MKKILFAASEAVPFMKTGGLADVTGSLPKYVDKKNYHVGQFIKVRINRASSATLFGDPVE